VRARAPAASLLVPAAILAVVAVTVRGHLLRHHPGASAPVVRASWTLTPGVLNPAVTQANIGSTICRRGWTSTIRPPVSYTNELKRQGLRAYGLSGPLFAFQEDHLISLELGGNPTDPRNLWPEPYPRASAVDRIENDLNAQICSGRLTLAEAQRRESLLKHTDG
jgi:hypothetical protein